MTTEAIEHRLLNSNTKVVIHAVLVSYKSDNLVIEQFVPELVEILGCTKAFVFIFCRVMLISFFLQTFGSWNGLIIIVLGG